MALFGLLVSWLLLYCASVYVLLISVPLPCYCIDLISLCTWVIKKKENTLVFYLVCTWDSFVSTLPLLDRFFGLFCVTRSRSYVFRAQLLFTLLALGSRCSLSRSLTHSKFKVLLAKRALVQSTRHSLSYFSLDVVVFCIFVHFWHFCIRKFSAFR